MGNWAMEHYRTAKKKLERVEDNDRLRRKLKGDDGRSDLVEKVVEEMCSNFCKYPLIWDAETAGYDLENSDICAKCPLNSL